jgi:hypothetical protein
MGSTLLMRKGSITVRVGIAQGNRRTRKESVMAVTVCAERHIPHQLAS